MKRPARWDFGPRSCKDAPSRNNMNGQSIRRAHLRLIAIAFFACLGCGGSATAPRPTTVERLRACDDGSPKACYRLGVQGLNLGTTPEHRRRAVNYLRKACRGEHAPACLKLNELYETACSAGTGVACFAAGQLYHQGRSGILRDLRKARDYYKAADKHGYRAGRRAYRRVRREIKRKERLARRAKARAERKRRREERRRGRSR
jgi:Sel1 repeat-containing protein